MVVSSSIAMWITLDCMCTLLMSFMNTVESLNFLWSKT